MTDLEAAVGLAKEQLGHCEKHHICDAEENLRCSVVDCVYARNLLTTVERAEKAEAEISRFESATERNADMAREHRRLLDEVGRLKDRNQQIGVEYRAEIGLLRALLEKAEGALRKMGARTHCFECGGPTNARAALKEIEAAK
jgi:hypothetical protein